MSIDRRVGIPGAPEFPEQARMRLEGIVAGVVALEDVGNIRVERQGLEARQLSQF